MDYNNSEYTRGMQDAIRDFKKELERRQSKHDSDIDNSGESDNEIDSQSPDGGASGSSKQGDEKTGKKDSGKTGQSDVDGGNNEGGKKESKKSISDAFSDDEISDVADKLKKDNSGKSSGENDNDNDNDGGNDGDGNDEKTDATQGPSKSSTEIDSIIDALEDIEKNDPMTFEQARQESIDFIKGFLDDATPTKFIDDAIFGDFFKKCISAPNTMEGFTLDNDSKSGTGWFKKTKFVIDKFIQQKCKKYEQEETYSNLNRRHPSFAGSGDIIYKGKRIKRGNLTLKIGVYIDGSGSMTDLSSDGKTRYTNALTCAQKLSADITKTFTGNAYDYVSDGTSSDGGNVGKNFFSYHQFQDKEIIDNIDIAKGYPTGGGTPAFESIAENIVGSINSISNAKPSDAIINVILTDGEMDGAEEQIKKLLEEYPSYLFIYVTLDHQHTLRLIAGSGQYPNFQYVKAGDGFSMNF